MNSYDEYLDKERANSSIFLKNFQIVDDRFDENEYKLIKSIWKNQSLIDIIYAEIDDVLHIEKAESDLRFVIISDFLFSMTSFDIRDPSEIVFKITRSEYFKRIKLRASINTFLNYNWEKYLLIHKKLLIGLRKVNILERAQVRTQKDGVWETTIYIKLKVDVDVIDENTIGYSRLPFIVISIYDTKYSIGSFRNIWKIKRKKREMEDINISYDSIIKANQIGFILSEKLYKLSKNEIEKEELISLKKINCNSIDHYFSKVKKICEDKSYSYMLLKGKEKIENITFDDILLLVREIKSECLNIISEFQKMLCFKILKKDIFNTVFYLPCFADNRTRQYYATLISPTFYVIFRYLYEFHIKKEFIKLEESTFYKKIIEYESIVKEFNLGKKESYIAIVLFIEIGKFFIKNDNEYIIKTENIIKIGIEKHRKKEIELKNILYLKKIYLLLDDLLYNKNIDKNTIIFKDATASGLQNYGILLGYQEDKLKYLNIEGKDWCDTYQYIINKFLDEKKFMKRKYWKSTIMTIPYNSTWFGCFKKFLEELRSDGIEYNEMTKEEKIYIKKVHRDFYDKVKNKIKTEFYKEKENTNLLSFKYNKWKIVSVKDFKINYKKLRDKYRDTLYMLVEDEKATQRALEANNMHYLDAMLVKEILKKFEIITIHDCFGVRLCELHLLMDEINKYYSEKIKKPTYSIHIII